MFFKKEELKFCKDCKYYRLKDYEKLCMHDKATSTTGIDLVTGIKSQHQRECWAMRSPDIGRCKPQAKYFEPIENGGKGE